MGLFGMGAGRVGIGLAGMDPPAGPVFCASANAGAMSEKTSEAQLAKTSRRFMTVPVPNGPPSGS